MHLFTMQSSYLSRISRVISVEKNLSSGEISDFCKEFEQFTEFYRYLCCFCSKFVWRKICLEKIFVDKKDKYEVCNQLFSFSLLLTISMTTFSTIPSTTSAGSIITSSNVISLGKRFLLHGTGI